MAEDEKREISPEESSYLEWREELWADPEYREIYEEEAAKSELWLQLVEARQQAGLTQKQMTERLAAGTVAHIENRG